MKVIIMMGTFLLVALVPGTHCCRGGFQRVSRTFQPPSTVERSSNEIDTRPTKIIRINSPGQRFTATHGIAMRAGTEKNFVFVNDRIDGNYMAISSNIAIKETRGGPEYYELYVRHGEPPTIHKYDQKSTVSASASYIGDVLYSRDITIMKPKPGNYFILLVANRDFHELLITAILDTPPEAHEAAFKIQRIGEMTTR